MYTPQTEREYSEYVEQLFIEFPDYLTWKNSFTGDTLHAGFYVQPACLPAIRQLLESIRTLEELGCVEPPLFRDFDVKRGYLSVNYDCGCDTTENLIDILETAVNYG